MAPSFAFIPFSGGGPPIPTIFFSMTLGGSLDTPTLPLSGNGSEISSGAGMLTVFQARRGVAGSAGTTTIQLELNGVAIPGATLSWTPLDADFTLKSVAVAVAFLVGDRLSFSLTSAETGGQDIFSEAN